MNSITPTFLRIATCTALLALSIAAFESAAQSSAAATKNDKPLNLDDQIITQDIAKESNLEQKTETVSVEPNKLDAGFIKAEKHGIIPDTTEINVTGTPQRVTKVTGKEGTYCVYSPTVARTDGIDEIQNGLQNQVRSCPP